MGPDEFAARARVIDAIDNLRAAFTWAMDRTEPADVDVAFRIVGALAMESAMRRSTGVGAWAERALERGELMTEAERFSARSALCWDLFQRGELVTAKAVALEAIGAGAPPGAEGLLQAYQCAATCAAQLGELDEALEIFAQAIDAVADLPAVEYSLLSRTRGAVDGLRDPWSVR